MNIIHALAVLYRALQADMPKVTIKNANTVIQGVRLANGVIQIKIWKKRNNANK